MIEINEINENALEIKSKAHVVRVLKSGDKTMFSAAGILTAYGVKAPTKWLERNAAHRPDMILTRLNYPIKTAKGYRRCEMIFVTGAVGKKLVKATGCSDETKKWLLEDVLTYKMDGESVKDAVPEEQRERWSDWADMLHRNLDRERSRRPQTAAAPSELDLSKRIDNILLNCWKSSGAWRRDRTGCKRCPGDPNPAFPADCGHQLIIAICPSGFRQVSAEMFHVKYNGKRKLNTNI